MSRLINKTATSSIINRIISEFNVGLLNRKNGKKTLVSLHFMYFSVSANDQRSLHECDLFFDNAEIHLIREFDIETFTILNTNIDDMGGTPCFKFTDMMFIKKYNVCPARTVSQVINEFKLELKHDIIRG